MCALARGLSHPFSTVTDEETQAQRSEVIFLGTHSRQTAESGFWNAGGVAPGSKILTIKLKCFSFDFGVYIYVCTYNVEKIRAQNTKLLLMVISGGGESIGHFSFESYII